MERVNAVVDQVLPEICARPTNVFDVPSILLSDRGCLSATVSRVLGLGIVVMAGTIKLPQIAKIVNDKSVLGLSVATFLFETFGHTYNLAAHYRNDYPITTYGDFYMLLAQNYVILLLIYRYTTGLQKGLAVVITYICALVLLCSPIFPMQVIDFLTMCNPFVVVATRVPQIYANFVNGSTGALSPATTWGIFLGACARIFTTLQDVDSFKILAGYLMAAFLNGIISFQVLYYRLYPSTKKIPAAEKEKKSE